MNNSNPKTFPNDKNKDNNLDTTSNSKEEYTSDSFGSTKEEFSKEEIDNYLPQIISALLESDDFKKKVKSNFNELVEDTKKDLRESIHQNRVKIVETLGIFVALFTFISVEFQVFRSCSNLLAIGGLTLIILGALLIFLIFTDFAVNGKFNIYKTKRTRGLLNKTIKPVQKMFYGSEEKEDLTLNPRSWGLGLKFTALFVGLIITGVILLSSSSGCNATKRKSCKKCNNTQVKQNK